MAKYLIGEESLLRPKKMKAPLDVPKETELLQQTLRTHSSTVEKYVFSFLRFSHSDIFTSRVTGTAIAGSNMN